MSLKIGEITFLEELAKRYKLPVPDFLVEPVKQSQLRKKLEQWGEGIVKPDILTAMTLVSSTCRANPANRRRYPRTLRIL